MDNLDYADGWTWFDENGDALKDSDAAAMTIEDKTEAFIEGRYAGSSNKGGYMGGMPDGMLDEMPSGKMGESPNADMPSGGRPDGAPGEFPDGATTQSNTGSGDSKNYATYEDMFEAYKSDIEEVYAGDEYGSNIVELYNPLNYIGAECTDNPTCTKIIMGASEGDISLFNLLICRSRG